MLEGLTKVLRKQEPYTRKVRLTHYLCAIGLALLLQSWAVPFLQNRVAFADNTAIIDIVGASKAPGFFPYLLSVHVNEPVTFINYDFNKLSHTIVANDGSFTSPSIPPSQQWTITLSKEGTYEYHDQANPKLMVGGIIVVPQSVQLFPTPSDKAVATAIASIKVGKNPPPISSSTALASSSPNSFIVPIVAITVVVLLISLGGFSFFRFKRRSHIPKKLRS